MIRTAIVAVVLAGAAVAFGLPMASVDNASMKVVQVHGKMLSVSIDEVTVAQWSDCVADNVCEDIAKPNTQSAKLPVTGVNWFDVQAYIAWVNAKHGRTLRLPTVDEWNVISGTSAAPARKPLFDAPRMAWAANYGLEETPRGPVRIQGAWSTSKDGIHDLEGNVWEWTSGCRTAEVDANRCPAFYVMGAHEAVLPVFVRNPAAGGCATGTPPTHVGFRLVEDYS